jgi:hypothetical protein
MTCTNCLDFIVCYCNFPFKARACTTASTSILLYGSNVPKVGVKVLMLLQMCWLHIYTLCDCEISGTENSGIEV